MVVVELSPPAKPIPPVEACCGMNWELVLSGLGKIGCAVCAGTWWGPFAAGSPLGRGLLRWSINCVVDDVGVALAEPAGEWVPEPP